MHCNMMVRIWFAIMVFLEILIFFQCVCCEEMFNCDSLLVNVLSTEISFISKNGKNKSRVQEIEHKETGSKLPMNTISINPYVSPSTVIPLSSCTELKLIDERRFTVCPPPRGLTILFCDQETIISLHYNEFRFESYEIVVKNGNICEAIIYDKESDISETNPACPLIPAAVFLTEESRAFKFDSGTLGIYILSRDLTILKENSVQVKQTEPDKVVVSWIFEDSSIPDFIIPTDEVNLIEPEKDEKARASRTSISSTAEFIIHVESEGVSLPPVTVPQYKRSRAFRNLKPFTMYIFKVIAVVDSAPEDVGTKEFQTWPGLPATPRLRTDLVYADGNKIEVNWDAVVEFNGEFETYEIVAKVGSEIVDSINSTDTRCTLEKKIAFESTYEVSVRAFTKPNKYGEGGGSGLYSNPVTVETEVQKQNVRVEQTALDAVVVSWEHIGSNSGFEVIASAPDIEEIIQKVEKDTNSSTFTDLYPYTLYSFNVFVVVGNTKQPVGSKVFMTWPGIPNTPSLILKKVFAEQNKIRVEWIPTDFFGDVDTYEAVAMKADLTAASCKTTLLKCILSDGLQYTETYKVSVRAITRPSINGKGGGLSEFSKPKSITTKKKVPNVPKKLTLTRPNVQQVLATWIPDPEDSDPNITYLVSSQKAVKTVLRKKRFANEETGHSSLLVQLENFTVYDVSVKACISNECSQPLTESIRTLPGIPGIPTGVTAVEEIAKEITVSWLDPEVKNGPLDNVTVTVYSENEQVGICSGALGVQTCTANGVMFFKEYIIRARACNAPEYNLGGGCSGFSADLKIKTSPGKPDAPFDVTVFASTAQQLSVSWTNPINANGPLDMVAVEATKDGNIHGQCVAVSQGTFCVIRNLDSNTEYKISTRAYNAPSGVFGGDLSNFSTPVLAKTLPEIPNIPISLTLTRPNVRQVLATWIPDPKDFNPNITYLVDVQKTGVEIYLKKNRFTKEETSESCLIKNREDYTFYNVSVKACISKDCSKPLTKSIRTLPGVPEIPTGVTAVEQKANEITVRWLDPEVKNGPLDNVTVTVYSVNEQVGICSGALGVQTCTINGVVFFTEYIIRVRACNAPEDSLGGGCSEFSEDVKLKTSPGIPEIPTGVTAVEQKANEITVSWLDPEVKNGPLDNVTVTVYSKNEQVGICSGALGVQTCTINGLAFFTDYIIRARACNAPVDNIGGGYSSFSADVKLKTSPGKPDPPFDVKVAASTAQQLSVSWTNPIHANGPLDKVTVNASKDGTVRGQCEAVFLATSCLIQNLADNMEYEISTMAYNAPSGVFGGGFSSPSTPVLAKTLPEKNPINIGLIVGIVIPVVVAIGLISLIVCCIKHKKAPQLL